MAEVLPDRLHRGRGAVSNRSGRFEREARVAVDDGWQPVAGLAEDWEAPEHGGPRVETTVTADSSRSIIANNRSPDIPFGRSINPYRGCEHGCVYCFARPTHAWLGLSAGLDFETRLFAKYDAEELLRRELAKPTYKPEVLALGANTDPYQPVERRLRITRGVLEVLCETRHPVIVITKSALVLRDLDLLRDMAADKLVKVCLSVTTLDRGLARALEPRAPTPGRRLEAIEGLAAAGVPVGVLAAPMIPQLNDSELDAILGAAADRGAISAGYVLLRLPLEIRDLFVEWLETHVPDRAKRVMRLVRETRGGRDYDATFGRRLRGQGVYADLLAKRFRNACTRLGLEHRRDHEADGDRFDESRFRRPPRDPNQLTLL